MLYVNNADHKICVILQQKDEGQNDILNNLSDDDREIRIPIFYLNYLKQPIIIHTIKCAVQCALY